VVQCPGVGIGDKTANFHTIIFELLFDSWDLSDLSIMGCSY
jgi:hypothetical protein